MEELDEDFHEARGPERQSSIFFDSDHDHGVWTRRSCTGLIVYVGRTPVVWFAKRQTSIQSLTYGEEFMAGRTAYEEAIAMKYMLHCLCCKLNGRTLLPGDNLGMLQSSSWADSCLKKKHVSLSYHKMHECVSTGIINPCKVDTKYNTSDFLTKSLTNLEGDSYHSGVFFGRWNHGEVVDMTKVALK